MTFPSFVRSYFAVLNMHNVLMVCIARRVEYASLIMHASYPVILAECRQVAFFFSVHCPVASGIVAGIKKGVINSLVNAPAFTRLYSDLPFR